MLGSLIGWVSRNLPRHWLHYVSVLGGRIVAQFYRGRRHEDPIDGFLYRKLLPYGRLERRPSALAPASLSLERHRLLWLYLRDDLRIEETPYRVLHMAPEWCLRRRFLQLSNLQYTSADLNSPWADVHCDIQSLPFADEAFDLILCNHVLEHIPDDHLAMRELLRVLSPGGVALLLVPQDLKRAETFEDPRINTDALREEHYGQKDHLRLYGRDYPARLAAEGFRVEELDYVSRFTEGQRIYWGLRLSDTLFIGRKEA